MTRGTAVSASSRRTIVSTSSCTKRPSGTSLTGSTSTIFAASGTAVTPATWRPWSRTRTPTRGPGGWATGFRGPPTAEGATNGPRRTPTCAPMETAVSAAPASRSAGGTKPRWREADDAAGCAARLACGGVEGALLPPARAVLASPPGEARSTIVVDEAATLTVEPAGAAPSQGGQLSTGSRSRHTTNVA